MYLLAGKRDPLNLHGDVGPQVGEVTRLSIS